MSSTLRKPVPSVPNPTPYQLRALVLDYLSHQSFTRTARAFAEDSAIRHLDADGDEVMYTPDDGQPPPPELSEDALRKAELRLLIQRTLLAGKVGEATELLDTHFPTVLHADDSTPKSAPSGALLYVAPTSVEPSHLNINLRIQSFIEACRTIPLEYPPNSTPSATPKSQKRTSQALEERDQQTALLKCAQKLYAMVNMLLEPDRDRYLKELNNVLGILAYKVPEESSVARYLSQDRREAVAAQINSAILFRSGMRAISNIELVARHTTTVWGIARDLGIPPLPGALLPPQATSPSSKGSKLDSNKDVREISFSAILTYRLYLLQHLPLFNLGEFLDTKA